jgi:hypothetical protein
MKEERCNLRIWVEALLLRQQNIPNLGPHSCHGRLFMKPLEGMGMLLKIGCGVKLSE